MLDKLLVLLEKYDKLLTILLWIMAAVFVINAILCRDKGVGYVVANIVIGVFLLLVAGPINQKGKDREEDSKSDNQSES